jgi:hypothetical protein
MRQPEPSVRAWPARLAAFLRAGSAMAGASLALILALNLEMVPIGPVAAPDVDVDTISASAPAGRGAGLRHWDGRAPAAGTGLVRADPTALFMPTVTETLPPSRDALQDDGATPTTDPADNAVQQGPSVALHLVPVDAAAMRGDGGADDPSDDQPVAPAVQPVGGPS